MENTQGGRNRRKECFLFELYKLLVLRQKCALVKDPTSDEMQDLAMNAMFTCVNHSIS